MTPARALTLALVLSLSCGRAYAQDDQAPVTADGTPVTSDTSGDDDEGDDDEDEVEASESEDETERAHESDDEEEEEEEEEERHWVPAGQVLPTEPGYSGEEPEPDAEMMEVYTPPPPEPEWRLRAGVGISVSTSGSDALSLRLMQEIEWMPAVAAPFLFGITGGEVIGAQGLYLAGARVGGAARFCQDRIVVCTGAVALRLGAVFGGVGGPQFDLGGDGDARFRFDGVELGLRIGFFLVSGNTYLDALALIGAAF